MTELNLNEAFKPMQEAFKNQQAKLGSAFGQINAAMKPFKEKIEEIEKTLSKIQAATTQSNMPAQSLYANNDLNQQVQCPACAQIGDALSRYSQLPLRQTIIHLNDTHHWTREKIADWLDTLPSQPVYYPDIRSDDEKIKDAQKQPKTYGPITLTNAVAGAKISILNSDGSVNQEFIGNGGNVSVTFQGSSPGHIHVSYPSGTESNFYPDGTVTWSK